jgi:predicted transcriptional regulator
VTTIRVTDETHRRIAQLSRETGSPMTDVVTQAIDALERKLFFADVNRRYEELRADPEAWAAIAAERAAEGGALRDASR